MTTLHILEEFKRFGKIESDGVFLRNREVNFFLTAIFIHQCFFVYLNLYTMNRILVSAMPLLSSKMFRVLGMQSRFEPFPFGLSNDLFGPFQKF